MCSRSEWGNHSLTLSWYSFPSRICRALIKLTFSLSCILISISSFFCRSHSLLPAICASLQCTHGTCSRTHSLCGPCLHTVYTMSLLSCTISCSARSFGSYYTWGAGLGISIRGYPVSLPEYLDCTRVVLHEKLSGKLESEDLWSW